MPTPILKRKRPRLAHRTHPLDPYYGYGYRPDWPSILSVAHDEADGGRLFVITDRPVVLVGSAAGLPLTVGSLSVLGATQVLPFKFRLQMSGAVPQGSAWAWGAGGGDNLVDPITNNPPNPSSGNCADVPGPYVPPVLPATVVSATIAGPNLADLTFDQAVTLIGGPFAPDGSIQFDGLTPTNATQLSSNVLRFDTAGEVAPGSVWAINAQPAYVVTAIAIPQNGTL